MDKRCPAPDRDRYVKGLGHLLEISAFLLAILRVGIDAIRTLDGMCDGEGDEAFLTCGQSAISKDICIVVEELLTELGLHISNLAEIGEVLGIVVSRHR